jgi:hypothetical protein
VTVPDLVVVEATPTVSGVVGVVTGEVTVKGSSVAGPVTSTACGKVFVSTRMAVVGIVLVVVSIGFVAVVCVLISIGFVAVVVIVCVVASISFEGVAVGNTNTKDGICVGVGVGE